MGTYITYYIVYQFHSIDCANMNDDDDSNSISSNTITINSRGNNSSDDAVFVSENVDVSDFIGALLMVSPVIM